MGEGKEWDPLGDNSAVALARVSADGAGELWSWTGLSENSLVGTGVRTLSASIDKPLDAGRPQEGAVLG